MAVATDPLRAVTRAAPPPPAGLGRRAVARLLPGRRLGAVEDGRLRVLRQVATLAVRGDAFADDRSAFNRALNRSHDLARWFAGSPGG